MYYKDQYKKDSYQMEELEYNKEDNQNILGSEDDGYELCPDCHGSGSLANNDTCSSCNGKGVI